MPLIRILSPVVIIVIRTKALSRDPPMVFEVHDLAILPGSTMVIETRYTRVNG